MKERFASRKFLSHVVVMVVIILNEVLKWGMSFETIMALITSSATYTGVEGILDYQNAKKFSDAVSTASNEIKHEYAPVQAGNPPQV